MLIDKPNTTPSASAPTEPGCSFLRRTSVASVGRGTSIVAVTQSLASVSALSALAVDNVDNSRLVMS